MDHVTFETLTKIKLLYVRLISIGEFESADEGLRAAKGNRSLIEYYFTSKACMPFYIFQNFPEVTRVTYMDADLFFFADPSVMEIEGSSVAIVEHRFPEKITFMRRFGLYNAGWLSFRRDENGMACLNWWRERCLEWCYDRPDGERFADQKYIDQFPRLFSGVQVVKNKGANLAPWNIDNYKLSCREGRVLVDGEPLIFFHFHGLRKIFNGIFESGLSHYYAKLTSVAVKHIFFPYMDVLFAVAKTTAPLMRVDAANGAVQKIVRGQPQGHVSPLIVKLLSWAKRIIKAIVYRSYIFYSYKAVGHRHLMP